MNRPRWLLIGTLVWSLAFAAPLPAQQADAGLSVEDIYTLEPITPDIGCWQHYACQQASHVAIHAGISAGLDEVGFSGKGGFYASAAFGAARELVLGPILHQSRCGGPWCNEQLGPLDGLVDLATRVGGAYLGWKGLEVLP